MLASSAAALLQIRVQGMVLPRRSPVLSMLLPLGNQSSSMVQDHGQVLPKPTALPP